MSIEELVSKIEAILFVAGEPVDAKVLQKYFAVSDLEMEEALSSMEAGYAEAARGFILKRSGNLVQLATNPVHAKTVELFLQPVQKQSLSQAALETLVIIAYNQPITRLEIEGIRGVKCDYSIQSLARKNLIEEQGRKDTVGKPILYGTTDYFLSHFGFRSLADLPPVHELEKGTETAETLTP